MAETPIFGVPPTSQGTDPFGPLRVIFASQRGTLVELGIGPIVTAGLILQVLQGSKMIDVDMAHPEDRALFTGASKVLSIVMTLFEGSAFILGGAYNVNGTLPSLQNLFSFNAWYGALYRGGNLPDMLGLIATVSVFLIVIYLNGLRVQIPVSYARYRGYRGKFPIKLFYVSNIPVIFAAALFGNV